MPVSRPKDLPGHTRDTTTAAPGRRQKRSTQDNDDDDTTRLPPSFLPPDLPLPSPAFSHTDMMARLQSTPIQSPVASPYRVSPVKLVDALLADEVVYLQELNVLRRIVEENLLGHELDPLAGPIEAIIDLSSELSTKLAQPTSYFSEPQKDCLLHFSRVVSGPYQAYFENLQLGSQAGVAQSPERIRLLALLQTLDRAGEADRDLDWLVRRPLSRVRAYSTAYKRLLHSSDDATDMFLAYETFHSLLVEARETLETARERQNDDRAGCNHATRGGAQRSVSGGSTSTQSSSNSRISAADELAGLQASLDTSQCRDVFSLAPTTCEVDIVPVHADPAKRTIVSRANFQLELASGTTGETIDCLVETILLTDQILINRPTFDGPRLMFAPLLRGVFHVSCTTSDPLKLELDIVGRQTLRLTAGSPEARLHWYELLLACEDFKLDSMPTVPRTLAEHVGRKEVHQPWQPLAPARLPPTPPYTTNTPVFGTTAPLRVIRENSQLSLGYCSDASGRTPDAKDHPPFQFDQEDDVTPRAVHVSNPLERPLPSPLKENTNASNQTLPVVGREKSVVHGPPRSTSDDMIFPDPPAREGNMGSVAMAKSRSVDLFSPQSYTDRFLRAPTLDLRSKTEQPLASNTDRVQETLKELDLDFTKDEAFDETILDLPTLPAFDFGDGIRRPSSVALNFSPNTMTNFGIPMRKVPAPTPLVIPDVAPLKISPQKVAIPGTLSQRRLGNELFLPTSLSGPAVSDAAPAPGRDVIFSTMAECFSWINGTWTPILMDDVDNDGRMKTVRSSQVAIFFTQPQNGSLEIYDKKDEKVLHLFGVFGGTSIIRDDSCDISVGFDVGADKVYYMFRAENPDKANAMQHALNQAKFAAPQNGFVTPRLPMTPLWPELDSSAALIESLKVKLYIFDHGKWVNKGSARLTVRMIAQSRNRRVTLTGKTKKNERIMLVDYITGPGDCHPISKTSISIKTRQETYMVQFKGGEKERAKVLGLLVD